MSKHKALKEKKKTLKRAHIPKWIRLLVEDYDFDLESLKIEISTPLVHFPDRFEGGRLIAGSTEHTGDVWIDIKGRKKK